MWEGHQKPRAVNHPPVAAVVGRCRWELWMPQFDDLNSGAALHGSGDGGSGLRWLAAHRTWRRDNYSRRRVGHQPGKRQAVDTLGATDVDDGVVGHEGCQELSEQGLVLRCWSMLGAATA